MQQMKVVTYCQRHVSRQYQARFYQLMKEWDGSPDYWQAFYNVDVLVMKAKEAKEK